jgi:hypothetical protein
MRSEFLLDGDAISGREPVGEKGEQFEGCQTGVGGVDVGIRLNLRFGSTHLAGALRWFLRVRNALARPRHERKMPLLANGRPVPWVFGDFLSVHALRRQPSTRGALLQQQRLAYSHAKAPALALATELHSTSKETPSRCHLVDNSSHHKQLIFTFTPTTA